ncbi:MAG: hypothetical protein IJK87_11510 [Prevotella sp.]|nr:hypothetical protein [Prevotella sp.]
MGVSHGRYPHRRSRESGILLPDAWRCRLPKGRPSPPSVHTSHFAVPIGTAAWLATLYNA